MEQIPTTLSFPLWYVLVCWDSGCMVLLWTRRHATKSEPLPLGTSLEGIPGQQSSSISYGVEWLLDKCRSLYKYGDAFKTVKVLEKTLQSLRLMQKG